MISFGTKVRMAELNTLSVFHQVAFIEVLILPQKLATMNMLWITEENHRDSFPHSSFFGPNLAVTFCPYSQASHPPTLSFSKSATSLQIRKVKSAFTVLNNGRTNPLELGKSPFYYLTHGMMTLFQVQKHRCPLDLL